jgi:hypothetical protein
LRIVCPLMGKESVVFIVKILFGEK